MDDRIPAIWAQRFIGGIVKEPILANRAMRGVDQIDETGQKVFQHAGMVTFPL